jgi:hypothetical protein
MEPLVKTLGEALAGARLESARILKRKRIDRNTATGKLPILHRRSCHAGIRSGIERVCLVAEDEEAAKAISGKVEWLASPGSILRLDPICHGLSMGQRTSSIHICSIAWLPS